MKLWGKRRKGLNAVIYQILSSVKSAKIKYGEQTVSSVANFKFQLPVLFFIYHYADYTY